MAGKKSGRALEKEGLARTDNGMPLTTIAQIQMINQKNYYTDFMKSDDQILALRLQNEETRNRMTTAARDKDRALAQKAQEDTPDVDMADVTGQGAEDEAEADEPSTKIIVIHPGSQNLRIGLATDALPKTVPMVIAKRSQQCESEENNGEPLPKRTAPAENDENSPEPETIFGDEFATEYNAAAVEFKTYRRVNRRRVLPNSRDLVVKWNSQTPPDIIKQHNDVMQIDWTELGDDAPERITGQKALRIPDESKPRYRLSWPWQHGWLNESDYSNRRALMQDFCLIIEDAITDQLGISRKQDLAQYSCVFVIPDLYEKVVVSAVLNELLRDFGFNRVAFIQESLAATFGAGYSISCVVDVGAQKTSIACVEEGLCLENTRMNLKVGGEDVTQTFIKMMLFDHFNYAEMNLRKRHDYLLAEELKHRFCTLSDENITVQQYDFFLRVAGQDTRKYQFKIYDEGMLAPLGLFRNNLFDHSHKLINRRSLIDRSRDTYDCSPNDPISPVQIQALLHAKDHIPSAVSTAPEATQPFIAQTPKRTIKHSNPLSTLNDETTTNGDGPSTFGSPMPDQNGTPAPQPDADTTMLLNGEYDAANNNMNSGADDALDPTIALSDRTVPVMPLDVAILASITEGAKGDERKLRDFLGGIMLTGGAAKMVGFNRFLEERLRILRPDLAKDILVGLPPREMDPAVLVWKGASVFAKLECVHECWIGRLEYDRLGARILNYKVMWSW